MKYRQTVLALPPVSRLAARCGLVAMIAIVLSSCAVYDYDGKRRYRTHYYYPFYDWREFHHNYGWYDDPWHHHHSDSPIFPDRKPRPQSRQKPRRSVPITQDRN